MAQALLADIAKGLVTGCIDDGELSIEQDL
jgi:hypothetical protein